MLANTVNFYYMCQYTLTYTLGFMISSETIVTEDLKQKSLLSILFVYLLLMFAFMSINYTCTQYLLWKIIWVYSLNMC